MSDMNFPKIGGTPAHQDNKIGAKKLQHDTQDNTAEKTTLGAKSTDIPSSAGTVGRSQVNFQGNVDLDLAMLAKNPGLQKTLDAFFNQAYADMVKQKVKNPYEEAATLTAAYAKEIAK